MDRHDSMAGMKLMALGSLLLASLVIFIFLNANTTAAALFPLPS